MIIIIIYYFLAKFYKLYDKPNSRSSHKFNTLNGGGILFPIAFILPFFIELEYYKSINIIIGITLISIISFLDDIKPISNFKRVLKHSRVKGPPHDPCVAIKGMGVALFVSKTLSMPVNSILTESSPLRTASPCRIYCAEK